MTFSSFQVDFFCHRCEARRTLTVPVLGDPKETLRRPHTLTHQCGACGADNALVLTYDRSVVLGTDPLYA